MSAQRIEKRHVFCATDKHGTSKLSLAERKSTSSFLKHTNIITLALVANGDSYADESGMLGDTITYMYEIKSIT